MNIKKDDNVIIIAGKDKGKSGKVITSLPKIHKVIVAGINIIKKNQKPRQKGQKGQIVEKTMPIDVSNVRLASEAKGEKNAVKVAAPKKIAAKKPAAKKAAKK